MVLCVLVNRLLDNYVCTGRAPRDGLRGVDGRLRVAVGRARFDDRSRAGVVLGT